MTHIILLCIPPVFKRGSPTYHVILEGGMGFGTPFETAQAALEQLARYQAEGHTLISDPEWEQAEMLRLFKERAAVGQY